MPSNKPKLPLEEAPAIVENLRKRRLTYRYAPHVYVNSVAEAIDMWVRWNA